MMFVNFLMLILSGYLLHASVATAEEEPSVKTLEDAVASDKCSTDLTCLSEENVDRIIKGITDGQERWNREVMFKLKMLMEQTAPWRKDIDESKKPKEYLNEEEQEELNQSLFNATMEGDLGQIGLALGKGADLDYNNVIYQGRTPLHQAVLLARLPAVKFLLRQGADPNSRDKIQLTPLHLIAYYGKDDVVRMLIDAGADVNAKKDGGETPLFIAAQNHHASTVHLLLEAGADIDATNDSGTTVDDLLGSPNFVLIGYDPRVAVREVLKEWRENN